MLCGLGDATAAMDTLAKRPACEALLRRRDTDVDIDAYLAFVVYVAPDGQPNVVHEACMTWSWCTWVTEDTARDRIRMHAFDEVVRESRAYPCDACGWENASLLCTGRLCRDFSKDTSALHFPCALLLHGEGKIRLDDARMKFTCNDCRLVKKRKRPACVYIDTAACVESVA